MVEISSSCTILGFAGISVCEKCHLTTSTIAAYNATTYAMELIFILYKEMHI